MHIQVEGRYKKIWNVQVFQTGMLSFKLKKLAKAYQSQYFMCHTTRQDTTTYVNFESIAALYNKLAFSVKLGAWKRGANNPNNSELTREGEIIVH